MKRAARGECAVATCGEAATATPDFGVALNFAGLWRVPVVFVVASDADAPSAGPRVDVTARAAAHGVAAARADGRDVADVERVMREALARARRGEGATLVDVSCSYPPQASPRSGLRLVEDAGGAWPGDPLARPVAELFRSGFLSDEREQQVLSEIHAEVANALAEASRLPPPPGALLFQDVFARRTPALSRQRAQWLDASRNPGAGR
jgi:TPP-dependent pyruvate/acetoin dehydrogenase alpha subunit